MDLYLKIGGLAMWETGYFLGIVRARNFNGSFVENRGWLIFPSAAAIAAFLIPLVLVCAGGVVIGLVNWDYAEAIVMAVVFWVGLSEFYEPDAGRVLRALRVPVLALLILVGVLYGALVWSEK